MYLIVGEAALKFSYGEIPVFCQHILALKKTEQ